MTVGDRRYVQLVRTLRSPELLEAFFKRVRPTFDSLFTVEKFLSSELEAAVAHLCDYYVLITNERSWENKFTRVREKYEGDWSLAMPDAFHRVGFPATNDECYGKSLQENWVTPFYDYGLEGWAYSFWYRRWKEGTIDTVYDIFKWLRGRE